MVYLDFNMEQPLVVVHVHLNNQFWPIEMNTNGLSALSNSHVSRDRKYTNAWHCMHAEQCELLSKMLSE